MSKPTRSKPAHLETLEARNRELAILGAIAGALNERVELSGTLEVALARVIELLDLETGWIWLLDAETGAPYLAASQSLPPGLAGDPRTMEGPCWCLDAFARDKLDPATNIGVLTCSRLAKLEGGSAGYAHHASIPIYAHGEKLGLMNVATKDWREIDTHELRLLQVVSGLLGIAIERTRLYAASVRLGAADERNRLAREFHDTLAQALVATAQQLELADAALERSDAGETDARAGAEARRAVTRALGLARATIEETRRSVHDLRATPLDGRSLPEALRAEVEAFRARTALDATFTTAGASRPLPPRVEVGLLRIGQEALANAEHHARATTVEVSLLASPSAIVLRVHDDGEGFDPGGALAATGTGRGLGIVGMNERARLLGGRLAIASTAGRGTEVSVQVPLDAGAA